MYASVNLGHPNTASLNTGLVAYWPFDGNTTSWNTNLTNDIVAGLNGRMTNMATSTSPVAGKIGQALYFSGSGANSQITGFASPLTTAQQANASVCFWIKPEAISVSRYILDISTDGTTNNGIGVSFDTSARFQFNNMVASVSAQTRTTAAMISNNVWAHFCATVSGGTAVSLYKNGVLQTVTTIAGNTIAATNFIGTKSAASTNHQGAIDDLRIYSRTLTAEEVNQVAHLGSANIAHSNMGTTTPPLSSGLIGYWPFDGNAINWSIATSVLDTSGSANGGRSVSMSTSSTPVVGKLGQALEFDGVNDQIVLAGPTTGTTFTYSAWLKPKSGLNYQNIFGQDNGLGVFLRGSGLIDFFYSGADHNSSSGLTRGVWSHVVVSVNAGAVSYYINGQRAGGSTGATSFIVKTIGTDVVNELYTGTMDDVRIYNRALSTGEVSQLYAYSQANIAHSNAVTLSQGLVGYWPLDGSVTNWNTYKTNDVSGSGNNGTMTLLSTTTSVVVGKIGQALKFTASTQNVTGSATMTLANGITMAAWIRPTSYPNGSTIFNLGSQSNTIGFARLIIFSSGHQFQYNYSSGSSQPVVSSNSLISLNVWTHLILTHDYTTQAITMYFNGIKDASFAGGPVVSISSKTPIIAAYPGDLFGFLGTIDDFRVYNRALNPTEAYQLYSIGK